MQSLLLKELKGQWQGFYFLALIRFKIKFHNLVKCICLDSMHLNFLQNYILGPLACIEHMTFPDLLITFGSYHVWTFLWLIISFRKLFQFFLIQFFNKQIIYYAFKFRIFKGASYCLLN